MDKQQLYEYIEAYLDGTLAGDELNEFEAKLAADPQLADEIRLHHDMAGALSETSVFRLENLLKEVGQPYREKPVESSKTGKTISLIRKYRALAAGLAFVVVAAIVLYIATSPEPDLYASYFEPYPVYLTTRSDDATLNETLERAVTAYKNQDYKTAWSNFLAVTAADTDDQGALFYTGMSALQTGKYGDAIVGFSAVAGHADNPYAEPAEWYLALSYLKTGALKQAKTTLEKIVKRQGDFQAQARQLLDDLD